MKTPYAAVLFDLDGTLLDTAPDFVRALNLLRAKHQLPPLAFNDIRNAVSDGSKRLIEIGFEIEVSHPDFETKRQTLLDLYLKHLANETQLFPSLAQLLDTLDQQSIPWGIVTNKPSLYALPLLEKLALNTRCGVLVCPDHVTERKPHPESLYLACQQLSVTPKDCLYIGDHQRDIQAGLNAGMTTIAAAYGYIAPEDTIDHWGTDLIAESPHSLHTLIFR